MTTPQQQRTNLVHCYKLTPAMLNRTLSDKEVSHLARTIPSGDSIASVLLGRVDRTQVNEDARNSFQRKQGILETWQDRNGYSATFDRLITVLVEAQEMGIATEVCNMLNPGQCEWKTLSCRLSTVLDMY